MFRTGETDLYQLQALDSYLRLFHKYSQLYRSPNLAPRPLPPTFSMLHTEICGSGLGDKAIHLLPSSILPSAHLTAPLITVRSYMHGHGSNGS